MGGANDHTATTEGATAAVPVEGAEPADPRRDQHAAPTWLDATVVAIGWLTFAFTAPGLVLAVLNAYAFVPAVVLGVAVAAAGLPVVRRVVRHRERATSRTNQAAAVAALALVVASFAWNAWQPGQYVLIDRDPGAYTTAGRWLARDGTLEPNVAQGAFTRDSGVILGSAAVFDYPSGRVEFQFNHALPVLLAEAYEVGGHRLMFRVPAALGAGALLAVYAVGCRLVRRPWLALAGTAALALSIPQVAFTRATYSESLTQLCVWSGLLALVLAWERRTWPLGLAAGLLFGATVMSRVDGLTYLLLLPVVAVLAVRTAPAGERRALRRTAVAVLAGAAATAALGWVDLRLRSEFYEGGHDSQLGRLRLALALAVALAVALGVSWPWLTPARSWLARHRRGLGQAAAVATLVGLLLAWLVRPVVQRAEATAGNWLVELLQQREGLTVAPRRLYDEMTMRWLDWYLGPVLVAFAVVGAAGSVGRMVAGRARATLFATVALIGPATVIYLWKPSIVPDQIWAMRRFLPAALPLTALLAVVAVDRLVSALHRPSRRWVLPAAGIVAVAMVAWVAVTTWPVRELRQQHPFLEVLTRTCDAAGPDSALLLTDQSDWVGRTLPMALRAWCGVPVAVAPDDWDAGQLSAMAEAWAAEGRRLVLVAPGPDQLRGLDAGRSVIDLGNIVDDRYPELTLSGPPDGYIVDQRHLYLLPLG